MPKYTPGSRADLTREQPKARAAKAFKRWFRGRPADEVVVFTNGSQKGDDVGYRFAVYLGQEYIGTGQRKLETPSLNFDGEAVGAWKGLEYVLRERPDLGLPGQHGGDMVPEGGRTGVCTVGLPALPGSNGNL